MADVCLVNGLEVKGYEEEDKEGTYTLLRANITSQISCLVNTWMGMINPNWDLKSHQGYYGKSLSFNYD